jgi:outer membrane immunogenic protein
MTKGFALAACLLAATPSAYAADLSWGSMKDGDSQPQAAWTGFYAGASLGAAVNRLSMAGEGYRAEYGGYATLEDNFLTSPSTKNTSFMGSLEAGYNWQRGNYVLGAAIDISKLSVKQSSGTAWMDGLDAVPDTDTASVSVDYVATLRARLGYAVSNNLLLYGTGGLAAVRFTGGYYDTDAIAGDKTSDTQWALGWAAGAGADYRIAQNWFVRGEYLHVAASTRLVTYVRSENETYSVLNKFDSDMFKLGVFYQF